MRDVLNNRVWRFFSTFWGVLYLAVISANFFSENMYEHVVSPLGTVYIATLAIFVGSKEFDRWHKHHPGKRRGEMFVVAFTIVIFCMFAYSFSNGEMYRVSPDISAAYIAVLSVFVISQKSKELHEKRSQEEKEEERNENNDKKS